jgi:transcriptional regulator with PAS, ATPase and Fis domain
MGETVNAPAAERPHEPRGSWGSLFQNAIDPVYLLSRRRQLRFANRAWESLTGRTFEAFRGAFCLPRKKKGSGPVRALLQALAPPPEAIDGRPRTVRRPAPPGRAGPPWWDITFVPLCDTDGLTGIFGFIRVVGQTAEAKGIGQLPGNLAALRHQAIERYSFDVLPCSAPVMARVAAQARLAASLKIPVWIQGEAGTGKEFLARVIHFQSDARERVFLAVDCAGLQPFLLKNVLFGHLGLAEQGLGTIFLKDPGALSRDLQAELLDWLDENDDPPRIMVGSAQSPDADVQAGRLVSEFVTAFNAFEIRLPPLRHRLEDLPDLVNRFIDRGMKSDVNPPDVAVDGLAIIARHSWPGNLRELRAAVRVATAAADGQRIEARHWPLYVRAPVSAAPAPDGPKLDEVLETVEARLIRLALRKAKGNKSEAADQLGVPRARLLRRIEYLKIEEAS